MVKLEVRPSCTSYNCATDLATNNLIAAGMPSFMIKSTPKSQPLLGTEMADSRISGGE